MIHCDAGSSSSLASRLKALPVSFYVRSPQINRPIFRKVKFYVRALLSPLYTLFQNGSVNHSESLWFPGQDIDGKEGPQLFWIPDFQHLYLPQFFSDREVADRNGALRKIAEKKGILLLSSQAALDDFNGNFSDAAITPRVWSFCSTVDLTDSCGFSQTRTKYGLPDKFAYIPNQFWAHKDHLTAFKAIGLLRDQGLTIPIVCTGFQSDYRNPGFFESLKLGINEMGLDHQALLLGVIPREEQIKIFRMAACIIQPSLFEGWSTVIEDAKSIGRPIIASDIPVHKEQLRDSVNSHWFFKKSDPQSLAGILHETWSVFESGPNHQLEKRARENTTARRLVSARDFMNIAREAIDFYKS